MERLPILSSKTSGYANPTLTIYNRCGDTHCGNSLLDLKHLSLFLYPTAVLQHSCLSDIFDYSPAPEFILVFVETHSLSFCNCDRADPFSFLVPVVPLLGINIHRRLLPASALTHEFVPYFVLLDPVRTCEHCDQNVVASIITTTLTNFAPIQGSEQTVTDCLRLSFAPFLSLRRLMRLAHATLRTL